MVRISSLRSQARLKDHLKQKDAKESKTKSWTRAKPMVLEDLELSPEFVRPSLSHFAEAYVLPVPRLRLLQPAVGPDPDRAPSSDPEPLRLPGAPLLVRQQARDQSPACLQLRWLKSSTGFWGFVFASSEVWIIFYEASRQHSLFIGSGISGE